jgi:2,3-bisphosphoglycerate-independent phosphoglycerate mutase
MPTTTLLLILDGFGYRKESQYNAIAQAHTPHWDKLWQNSPKRLISGSGEYVGLPQGQMGNSEVGHLNLGAGRTVHQEYTRINQAIKNGDFFNNPAFHETVEITKQKGKKLHIFGLLSPGGVHSHEDHIHALLKLAANQGMRDRVYIHVFLDGRDTSPQSAQASLEKLQQLIGQYQCGQIGSIVGRYYAMDRDNRWSRIQQVYDMLTQGKANYYAATALEGLQQAYQREETDEFVAPTLINKQALIDHEDSVVFMNYRADRARQLTQAFTEAHFNGFPKAHAPRLSRFVTLTQYAKTLPVTVAFPARHPHNGLGEYLSQQNYKQLRLAETEKYAHVTFFFNGGIEEAFPGEERVLVPSPQVATYDLQPEMSIYELTDQLIEHLKTNHHDLIVCNFANADMVGHTGNFKATLKAIESIDDCLGKLVKTLQTTQAQALITADHGNAELMYDEIKQQPHTAHTNEPVPLVYIGNQNKTFTTEPASLADIAPTLLRLMKLDKPPEMTGKNLFKEA